MLAAGLIGDNPQAHLALARVGEQPHSWKPTSLPVRTSTSTDAALLLPGEAGRLRPPARSPVFPAKADVGRDRRSSSKALRRASRIRASTGLSWARVSPHLAGARRHLCRDGGRITPTATTPVALLLSREGDHDALELAYASVLSRRPRARFTACMHCFPYVSGLASSRRTCLTTSASGTESAVLPLCPPSGGQAMSHSTDGHNLDDSGMRRHQQLGTFGSTNGVP